MSDAVIENTDLAPQAAAKSRPAPLRQFLKNAAAGIVGWAREDVGRITFDDIKYPALATAAVAMCAWVAVRVLDPPSPVFTGAGGLQAGQNCLMAVQNTDGAGVIIPAGMMLAQKLGVLDRR